MGKKTSGCDNPLGSYEDSAECCVPSAQEPSEVPQCHLVVNGEPNALGRLGLQIAAQVAPQVLQTWPMHWPTPGAESDERSAVAPESVGSAEAVASTAFAELVGDAAALMVLAELVARPAVGSAIQPAGLMVSAELVARPVAGSAVQPAGLVVSAKSAAAALDQQLVEVAKTWQQPDVQSANSRSAQQAVDAPSLTTEGSSSGLAP